MSITDKDLSALILESFKDVLFFKSDTVCWVTSKLTTGEMAPIVLDVFDLITFSTIMETLLHLLLLLG